MGGSLPTSRESQEAEPLVVMVEVALGPCGHVPGQRGDVASGASGGQVPCCHRLSLMVLAFDPFIWFL